MLSLRHVHRLLGALLLIVLTASALVAAPPVLPATVTLLVPAHGGLQLLLLAYVLLVGTLVARYAATNLRGQARTERFAALLLTTVLALGLMVATGHLVVSAVGATLSGWTLAALVAHRDDEAAHRAARVVRSHLLVGDLALWAAVATHLAGGPDAVVALGLAAAVVVRTGLVPAHRWLPETSEAPSPVSALLHGGVVNGGLMLALVHWELVASSVAALALLGAAGAASVVLGLVHSRLRPDVKGRLASSTTAQMGLGAIALALVLPQAALLHLLGHGLWKGWLFLRAGGSVARASAPAPGRAGAGALVAAGAAATALLALGLGLGAALDLPGTLALPAVLAAVLVGAAVLEAVRLERVGRTARAAMAAASLLVLSAYLAGVALLDSWTHDWFTAARAAVDAPWALAAAAAVVVLAASVSGLGPHSTGPLALLAAPGLLPPAGLARGDVRTLGEEPRAAALADAPHAPARGDLPDLLAVATSSVPTSWPLSSLVAVNPMADLERFTVEDAAAMVARLHGRDPRPALALFLDLHARGVIPRDALVAALAEAGEPHSEADVETLLAISRDGSRTEPGAPLRVRLCDRVTGSPGGRRSAAELLDLQSASWTARAWGHQGSGADPWTLWRAAATQPLHELAWGTRGLAAWVRTLPLEADAAVVALWAQVRARAAGTDFLSYSASVLTAAPGWTGHAKWRAAHAGDPSALVSLLALRMALDLVVAEALGGVDAAPASGEVRTLAGRGPAHLAIGTWQRALDLSARDGLVNALTRGAPAPDSEQQDGRDRVQSVWCIDVRSERVRRSVERTAGHSTYGYAGFFGAAVQHRDLDGSSSSLCPGLLSPGLEVADRPRELAAGEAVHRWITRVGRQPAAAFGYAEVNGLPALAATVVGTASPARGRRLSQLVTGAEVSRIAPVAPLPHDVAVDVAEALLVTTGIGERPGEVVVLVGHASTTENNAFAAAYDCGACGGHPGALNAHLVAEALNDPDVRADLAGRGIAVPRDTVFVAAQHDTTTDRVRRVDVGAPPNDPRVVRALAELDDAGLVAADERRALLPGLPSGHSLAARAADWAEPMPEWGLAGNLALVVGPRSLTRGLDLGGTAFLHSYEPGLDPDGSVLAGVMAGPVVVTQWINAQYAASTSAPALFGSGDKTTHNVVGGVGVLTGAHGDLRSGLPWQAVADHDPGADAADSSVLRHLPVRHLVVVAAPRARVERLVREHRGLHDVVAHGWLQLLVVEPGPLGEGRRIVELGRDLGWRDAATPRPARVPVG